jgi:hypothetical protein
MFSLGLIKVQTCYYGGVAVIRDDEKLFDKMYKLQERYQLFTKQKLVKRIAMGWSLMTLTNHKSVMSFGVKAVNALYNDREDFFVALLRGFKPDKDYLGRYRFRPCAALVAFIYDRVSEFDVKLFDLNCKRQ